MTIRLQGILKLTRHQSWSQESIIGQPLPQCWDLCPKIRRVSSLQSRLPQVLWGLTVATGANTLLEGPFIGFRHGITDFNQLKGRKLWLHPSYHRSAHENSALWASQGHHWYSGVSWSHFRHGSPAPWPLQFNHIRYRLIVHLQILIIALLLPWHQTKTLNCLPSSDRWPD